MNIDDEAVEIVREHNDFREADTAEKLFVIKPISKNGEVYYLDLRNQSWNTYGYKGNEDKKLPEMKPTCLKEVKSEIRGRNSQTLDQFSDR